MGAPAAAQRLRGRGDAALADEPLLGHGDLWRRWFAQAGVRVTVQEVATFNDAGLMLQAADAPKDGQLVRLSPLGLPAGDTQTLCLVYPPTLHDWPPLQALRSWLKDELARSRLRLPGVAP